MFLILGLLAGLFRGRYLFLGGEPTLPWEVLAWIAWAVFLWFFIVFLRFDSNPRVVRRGSLSGWPILW